MPDPKDYDNEQDWMAACVPMRVEEGDEQDQAVAACMNIWREHDKEPTKAAIKAVGDWEIDVLAIPYGSPADLDADKEYFSPRTNLHRDKFTPLVTYVHGADPSGKGDQPDPVILGEVKGDHKDERGHWLRIVLDKTKEYAQRYMDAVKRGVAGASSGSIAHLVRKAADGEILNWPLAEITLVDDSTAFAPRNKHAVALPVMKATYKAAGRDLPSLPEAQETPEAEPQARTGGDAERNSAPAKTTETPTGEPEETMTEELKDQVQAEVAAALKAEREAREAAEAAAKAEQERVEAAVKAEREKWEAEAAKANRLPSDKGINVRQHPDIDKYDDLTPGEHAFMLQVQRGILHRRGEGEQISDASVKALAMKAEAEAEKDKGASEGMKALRQHVGDATKAWEINYSTYSTYGDQWVGVMYHTDLWEKIRAGAWVLQELERGGDVRQIPDGFESDIVPLESTDPTWYHVAQATAHDATSGRPVATITSSKIGTAQKSVTLAKVGCRVIFTGELVEDSLIRWVPNAYRQIQKSGEERIEHLLIDGDVDTTQYLNINDEGGTPTAGDLFLAMDGFRNLALVGNTANTRAGGALDVNDYLETAWLMGNAGVSGADPTKVSFIVDPWTYKASLKLPEVLTRDVFSGATIENGNLTGLWGYPIR
ncbi:MAG: hypothetical protein ABIJ49_09705, partial [Pseudomonadota bacterium]